MDSRRVTKPSLEDGTGCSMEKPIPRGLVTGRGEGGGPQSATYHPLGYDIDWGSTKRSKKKGNWTCSWGETLKLGKNWMLVAEGCTLEKKKEKPMVGKEGRFAKTSGTTKR